MSTAESSNSGLSRVGTVAVFRQKLTDRFTRRKGGKMTLQEYRHIISKS